MSDIVPPYELIAMFEDERWILKSISKLQTVNGIVENQAYILTFRQKIKKWKKLEDLLYFVHSNYSEYSELKVILPFDLILISKKGISDG